MKLTDKYDPFSCKLSSNYIYESLNSLFLNIIRPVPPINNRNISYNNGFDYLMSDQERDFYENDYVVLSEPFDLANSPLLSDFFEVAGEDLPIALGLYEKDILEILFTDNDFRINVITGEVGWGKSSVVRYCIFKVLNRAKKPHGIRPYYFDFNTLLTDLNGLSPQQARDEIKRLLVQALKNLLKNELSVTNEQLWEFLESEHEFIDLAIHRDFVKSAFGSGKEGKKAIYEKRYDLIKTQEDLVFHVLGFFVKQRGLLPVFILDNIDPLNHIAQSELIKYFHQLCQRHNVKVIIPMRPTTLTEIQNKKYSLSDAIQSVSLELVRPVPHSIIQRNMERMGAKIENTKNPIRLDNGVILDSKDQIAIVNEMFELIRKDEMVRFLDSVSGGNLNEWGKIVRDVFSSGLIAEHRVVANILKRSIPAIQDQDAYNPAWIVYSAVITGNNRSFFSRSVDANAKDRICNVFSNRVSTNSCSLLIRLHILSYLAKKRSCQLQELREHYLEVFTGVFPRVDVLVKDFNYAIRIMINCGLLRSNQFFKIDSNGAVADLDDIAINDICGKYYFHDLISNLEYLKYMKDDVDLPHATAKAMKSCVESDSINDQAYSILHFLRYFFNQEALLYSRINFSNRHLYNEYFAFDAEQIFYSLQICSRVIEHVRWKLGSNITVVNALQQLETEITKKNRELLNELKI